jgi:hypothetical protein
VLLASVVTYFAINVVSTRVQEESLHLTKQHIWYATNGSTYSSEAAIMIINTGGRDVVIDKLTIRGQECPWTAIYYNVTTTPVSTDLIFNSTLVNGGTINLGIGYTFVNAATDVVIESGRTLILYVAKPDSITVNDIGLTAALTVFTSQAMYYKECNVEAGY